MAPLIQINKTISRLEQRNNPIQEFMISYIIYPLESAVCQQFPPMYVRTLIPHPPSDLEHELF